MSIRHIPISLATRTRLLATLIVATCILTMVADSHATAIRFDNPAHGEPGHYHWNFTRIDITLDAASQPNVNGDTTFIHTPTVGGNLGRTTVGGAVREDVTGEVLVPFALGELINNGGFWGTSARVERLSAGVSALLPEDVLTYVGVSVTINGNIHYGWIGVVMDRLGGDTYQLEPFAWGYETAPNLPIAAGVPEPGSLALLALGAVGVLARRRRS